MISTGCKSKFNRLKKSGSPMKKITINPHSKTNDFSVKGAQKIVKNRKLWMQLTDKYDVCNASFEQLSEISSILFRAGEISLIEHAIITFYPVNTIQISETNSNEINTDASSKINWLSVFNTRLTKELVAGNTAGYRNTGTIIKILEQLKRL